MIPQRIMLRGFLCYRDEQEVLLDGSSLWMMAGLNGSGKSAIFDAMTFALFGYHRGGSQQYVELINHDSDKLAVEFDFTLDGDSYRARRTAARQPRLGNARTTQQILRRDPSQADKWDPIDTTGTATGFKAWIHDRVGLNYETFTSSVLLLQNKAEKLLDSTAVGRFEVLAGIVDLDRFRRLHERADVRRKELKASVEALRHQLEGLPQIGAEDLAAVDQLIADAEGNIGASQAEVARLVDLEQHAKQWAELLARKDALEQRWRDAEGTLTEAQNIEKDLRRLQELNEVLPQLQRAAELRAKVRTGTQLIERLSADEKALAEKIKEAEHRIQQTTVDLTTFQKRRDEDETRHRDVQEKLRDLSALISRVEMCDQQRDKLKKQQAELELLPVDLDEKVTRLKEDVDRLNEIQRVLPLAARLNQSRKDLRQARERETALGREETERKAKGAESRKKTDALKQAAGELEKRRQDADASAVELKTLLERARSSVKEFQSLRGAKLCRHCGQPLTAGHFEEEKRKREAEAETARLAYQSAEQAQKKARAEEAAKKEELAGAEAELLTAREEYAACKNHLDQSRREVERLTRESGQTLNDLPTVWRQRASGAGSDGEPSFPTDADLKRLRDQVDTLEPIRLQLRETEGQLVRWQSLRVQVEEIRKTLQTLEATLPGDVGALKRKHVQLTANESTLNSSLKATRAQEKQATADLDKLNRDKNELHQKRTNIGGTLKTEEGSRQLSLEEIERIRQKLPSEWQKHTESAALAEITRWDAERRKLIEADTEGKAKRLHQARIALESLKLSRAEIDAECARFPAEARVSRSDVQRDLQAARAVLTGRETALRDAQRRKDFLEHQRQQRDSVDKELTRQDGAFNRYTLLAQLLGRDRLQRHLVRQAEREVVDHANAVLDRLSGGQLYLRLRGGEEEGAADRALELEAYNRSTTQAPINVTFLSGSQRFRVAVSLALGLGQYASRQHRPIESVIIDEGFGCLDRQGRQVMIQELQNLRGQLRCILLVSHQEEFADAFSDGYLFELDNGATRVRRFQK